MVAKAKSLKVFPLESEFAALLKEAELIREFQPRYNLKLKDGKTPAYIVISFKQKNPEVLLVRQNQFQEFKNAEVFGPFLSAKTLKTVLKVGRRIFPFCDHPNINRHPKACFYYHLKLCPGICVGIVSPKSYLRQIKRLTLFLKGDHQKLLRQLSADMKHNSNKMDFEAAAKIRDQISAIKNLNEVNVFSELSSTGFNMDQPDNNLGISTRIEGYDISHLQGKWATASMVVFINGLPAKEEYRQFRIESFPSSDDPKMLSETLARRFMHPEWDFPDLIMIDGGEPQLRGIFSYFNKLPVKLPRIVGLVKGEETIIVPENNIYNRINLPKSDPFLKTLMALRDKAHRFARRYHHQLRLKSLIG